MLTQNDVVRLLCVEPAPSQVVCFSILHAYVYSKSARGNLPSETLSKLISVQRKLLNTNGGKPYLNNTSVRPAFDAMKAQLMQVNKKWFALGPLAFGPLGAIGATGGDPLAENAWKKATDNKIKEFPSGPVGGAMGWMPGEMDAGRVIEPVFQDSADPNASFAGANASFAPPPLYDGPPASDQPDATVTDALNERREQDAAGATVESQGWRDSIETERRGSVGGESLRRPSGTIEDGAAHLARLRQLKEEKEKRESASPSPAPPIIEEER